MSVLARMKEDNGDAAPHGSNFKNKHVKRMSEALKGKGHTTTKQAILDVSSQMVPSVL